MPQKNIKLHGKIMKRWTQIFKTLSNVNRLKIIVLLSDGKRRSVSEIAREIRISVKATSKHLILLANIDILDAEGTMGHVFYSTSPNIPKDIGTALKLFL